MTIPAPRRSSSPYAAASGRATYEPYREGVVPWHAAVAATYCHATAPLRRLGGSVRHRGGPRWRWPRTVPEPHRRGVRVAARDDGSGQRAVPAQADRAALDLAEAVVLEGRVGETFDGGGHRRGRPRRAHPGQRSGDRRLASARHRVDPGDPVRVKLVAVDPERARSNSNASADDRVRNPRRRAPVGCATLATSADREEVAHDDCLCGSRPRSRTASPLTITSWVRPPM